MAEVTFMSKVSKFFRRAYMAAKKHKIRAKMPTKLSHNWLEVSARMAIVKTAIR